MPLDDWGVGIPFQTITQIVGAAGSGKTALLLQLVRDCFLGGGTEDARILYISNGAPTIPAHDRSNLTIMCPSNLRDLRGAIGEFDPTEKDLVLIDDAAQYRAPRRENSGRMWSDVAGRLSQLGCTTVVAGTVRNRLLSDPSAGSLVGKGLDFVTSLILQLDFIVTTKVGPVIEVTASKNRFGPPPEPLRLWVRPDHKFPISRT